MSAHSELLRDPETRSCYTRIRALLVKRGAWQPEFEIGLAPVAAQCASYLKTAREVRALEGIEPETRKKLEAEVEEARQLARDGLTEFAVLDPELSRFAVVNAEGLDAVIAALCAPLDPE